MGSFIKDRKNTNDFKILKLLVIFFMVQYMVILVNMSSKLENNMEMVVLCKMFYKSQLGLYKFYQVKFINFLIQIFHTFIVFFGYQLLEEIC